MKAIALKRKRITLGKENKEWDVLVKSSIDMPSEKITNQFNKYPYAGNPLAEDTQEKIFFKYIKLAESESIVFVLQVSDALELLANIEINAIIENFKLKNIDEKKVLEELGEIKLEEDQKTDLVKYLENLNAFEMIDVYKTSLKTYTKTIISSESNYGLYDRIDKLIHKRGEYNSNDFLLFKNSQRIAAIEYNFEIGSHYEQNVYYLDSVTSQFIQCQLVKNKRELRYISEKPYMDYVTIISISDSWIITEPIESKDLIHRKIIKYQNKNYNSYRTKEVEKPLIKMSMIRKICNKLGIRRCQKKEEMIERIVQKISDELEKENRKFIVNNEKDISAIDEVRELELTDYLKISSRVCSGFLSRKSSTLNYDVLFGKCVYVVEYENVTDCFDDLKNDLKDIKSLLKEFYAKKS
jgi:hypothetical protein